MKLSNIFSLLCLATSSAVHGAVINTVGGNIQDSDGTNTEITPGNVKKIINQFGGAKAMPKAKSGPKANTVTEMAPRKALVDPTLQSKNFEPRIYKEYNTEVPIVPSLFFRTADFPKFFDIYIVKEDDTVEAIAKKFSVDKNRLESSNQITTIKVNDLLKVPQQRQMSQS